jgi:hypothetical protein
VHYKAVYNCINNSINVHKVILTVCVFATGFSKLGMSRSSQLRLVLEEDGTQVDEEEYFNLLPGNQTFLFLLNSEEWKPAVRTGKRAIGTRENLDSGRQQVRGQ